MVEEFTWYINGLCAIVYSPTIDYWLELDFLSPWMHSRLNHNQDIETMCSYQSFSDEQDNYAPAIINITTDKHFILGPVVQNLTCYVVSWPDVKISWNMAYTLTFFFANLFVLCWGFMAQST